ncbi:meiotically up-regulated gene 113-domain-containing protein [Chaetomidium leptoderma]|uniref:Meiotically up-regulated gene 113-domain-containing protein n=1 Tax=Chaetomidium leptoderma TaxID=669021 RepID=A0AAN6ZY18_9PEZI|nr:meiotically up-regulated gene 113-domain-containing protein [Chaetomidium leptoderma]
MPFYANTPESRLGRADSKNPSSTCRGITSSGRPCRRPIGAEDAPPENSRLKPSRFRTDNPADENLYCWQHKDQASASATSSPGPRMSHMPILEERTSIDTLADRLGLIRTQSEKPQNGPGRPRPPKTTTRPKPKKESLFCFCFRIPSFDEVDLPPRPRPQPVQPMSVSTPPRPGGKKTSAGQHAAPSPYMSVIHQDTPPQIASQLLAELAKPVSQQDEAGYIYIFWLTPESEPSTPPAEAARSLLAPPSTPNRGRRPSDVLTSFARSMLEDDDDDDGDGNDDDDNANKNNKKKKKETKKILLKIGRATNVQRRLNEWQRQCGYNLSLIRYYPYIPSSSPGGVVARKIPHSHKVERLVHIELTGRGLRVADREKCETCGREHREWFEVEATRAAVADVDEVVRRWSDWDEGLL